MQVAVARMEDVRTAQAIGLFHAGDARQDFGQALARNGAVHAVVVGRDAARRGKGVLAARPELHALRFRLRDGDGAGARPLQHGRHAGDFLFHFLVGAVRLAQQDGGRIGVIAGLDERFDHARRGLVHHFQPRRDDAGGDHVGHRIAARDDVAERGHDDACRGRFRDQLDRHFRDDAQHAFGADEDGQQVKARRIERFAAQFQHLAIDGDDAHAQHVVHGESVFQAMHAARVFRHVAADAAGDLRGRVGRVIQRVRRRRFRDGQVAHARLHHGRARIRIEAHDAVQARRRQHHAIGDRQGAAGQARAGAARHDRHVQRAADAEDGDDLFLRVGQSDHHRQLAIGGQAVAFVGARILGIGQHAAGRQHGQQGGDDGLLARGGQSGFRGGIEHRMKWAKCMVVQGL